MHKINMESLGAKVEIIIGFSYMKPIVRKK